jgi:hypothetical protein
MSARQNRPPLTPGQIAAIASVNRRKRLYEQRYGSVPKPERTRKARKTKKRNVPELRKLIEEKFAEAPPSTTKVEIHFDEIRERCHDGEPVKNGTIRRTTIYPAGLVVDFPYSLREKTKKTKGKKEHFVIVTKIG